MLLLGLPQTRLLFSTDFLGCFEARYAEPKEQLLSAQRQTLESFDLHFDSRHGFQMFQPSCFSASDSPGEV